MADLCPIKAARKHALHVRHCLYCCACNQLMRILFAQLIFLSAIDCLINYDSEKELRTLLRLISFKDYQPNIKTLISALKFDRVDHVSMNLICDQIDCLMFLAHWIQCLPVRKNSEDRSTLFAMFCLLNFGS